MTINDDDLDRWEALASAATPGPWQSWRSGNAPLKVGGCGQSRLVGPERPYNPRWVGYENPRTAEEWHRTCVMTDADADFVALARTAVPYLCAEVRRLQKELADAHDASLHNASTAVRVTDERDALRIVASELRACLADAVGKIEATRAEVASAMQRGFDIAVEHAWISEHDGWHRTAPTIDWEAAEKALAEVKP